MNKLEALPPINSQINYTQTFSSTEKVEDLSLRHCLLDNRVGRAAISLIATLGITAGLTGEASADTINATHQIYDTAGDGVFLHTDGQPTLHGELGEILPDGTSFDIECRKTGDFVNGNPIWLYGTDRRTGKKGTVTDYYVDTRWNTLDDLTRQGIPDCSSVSKISSEVTLDRPIVNPDTPNYVGKCEEDLGLAAIKSWNSALGSINGDGAFKSQLEQYSTLWGNPGVDDICIGARLSDPDIIKHRQFVSSVVTTAPDMEPTGCTGSDLVEIWGDGFYKKTPCTDPTKWVINKWLADHTNICAAISSAVDFNYYKSADEAATAVKSGEVKLGDADPDRRVTCVTIKT